MANAVTQGDKQVEIADRAEAAYTGLSVYTDAAGRDDDMLEGIMLMITDLLHLADQHGMNHAPSFVKVALSQYDKDRTAAGTY